MRRGALFTLGLVGIAFSWLASNWQTILIVAVTIIGAGILAMVAYDVATQRRLKRQQAEDRARLDALLESIEEPASDLLRIVNLDQDERKRPHAPDGIDVKVGLLDVGGSFLSRTAYYYVRDDGAWVLCQPRWARRA